MNPMTSLGFGIIVGGVMVMLAGIFAPRWRPGDYARLVDIGFESCMLGAVIVLASYIFFGV